MDNPNETMKTELEGIVNSVTTLISTLNTGAETQIGNLQARNGQLQLRVNQLLDEIADLESQQTVPASSADHRNLVRVANHRQKLVKKEIDV